MGEDRHGHHAEHLQESEDAGADVAVPVPFVVGRAVEPGPADDDGEKDKAAQTRASAVRG